MIDFRYHLVSIAGIFLALAVGIVLGAGPLKGEISSTITNEVASLRADKSQLNDEVADLKSGTEARDKLLTQTSPTVLSGTLAGRSVAMVALPGVDANFMAATRATLVASGAEVASSVSVTDKWPASAASGPTAAVTEIAGILGVERAGDGVLADQVLGALLAGRRPVLPAHSVCLECKLAGNVCVTVAHGTPCLGPITHAGCGALCPTYHRGCYGCFGPMETPNTDAMCDALAGSGMAAADVVRALRTFNGWHPDLRAASSAIPVPPPVPVELTPRLGRPGDGSDDGGAT